MKNLLLVLIAVLFLLVGYIGFANAADVKLAWDANSESDLAGYKVYMSVDHGATWAPGVDVGSVTAHTYPDVSDTGLILFRVSAYNTYGETIRYEAGAWYCKDFLPVLAPSCAGVQ